MPTPEEVREELDKDPEGLGYSDLLADADDAAITDLINEKKYRGYVPIVELSAFCTRIGLTGTVEVLANEPTSQSNPLEFKALCRTVLTILRDDYRLSVADVDDPAFGVACDNLIGAGVMAPETKTTILAMAEDRRSRAEVLWGDGTAISPTQVGEARNSG